MGPSDDNTRSGDGHLGFVGRAGLIIGCCNLGRNWHFLPNFSAKITPASSQNVYQVAACPIHHLPMGSSDDNTRSRDGHLGFVGRAGLNTML